MSRTTSYWLTFLVVVAHVGSTFFLRINVAEASGPPPSTDHQEAEANPEGVPLVGWLELSDLLPDGPVPYAWMSSAQGTATLRGIIQTLEELANDDRYLGLVIHLDNAVLGLAQINEISRAIQSVKAAGRKVFVFAQRYDLLSYTLACSADKILLQHKGSLELSGLSLEELYLADLLEKIGVEADLLQIGQFKGAQEPFTRNGPSEAWNQTMDRLLDDIYDIILDQIGRGRRCNREAVEALLRDSWTMTDANYVKRGVIDYFTDRDLTEVTSVEFGDEFEWSDLLQQSSPHQAIDNPFALFQLLFKEPTVQVHRPSLAVVRAAGAITTGDGQSEGMFGNKSIGSRKFVRVLRDARKDSNIKGVLVRLDSPGGSALASETIWQAVRQLAETKPVFVSIGSMAASGGYYIACAGDQIYASRGSLIGSIGVVGGKVILGRLYDKIGVKVHRRTRGPHGDMFNTVEPFTNRQRDVVEALFQRTYEQFTSRVMTGRGDRINDIDAVAHGRMFTGRMAVDNGMIDQLGGIDLALEDLARHTLLEPGTYDIINLPPPQSLSEMLEQFFQFGSVRALEPDMMAIRMARAALGRRAWQVAHQVLSGLASIQHEPVLLLLPIGLVIR